MSVVISPWPGGKGWRVRVKLVMPDGRKIDVSKKSPLTAKTASNAWGLELEKQVFADAMRPKDVERPPAPTIAEFAPRFLDYLRSRRRAPATISAYEVALRLHVVPTIGNVRLDRLEPDDHERLLKGLSKLKPSSASEVVKTANRLITVAETLKAVHVRPPRCPAIRRDPPSVRAYTSEETARLLAGCTRLADKALVVLGVHGGMRRSEIAALRREDFVPDFSAVTIARHVWQREVLEGTKHGAARTVRLGPAAAAVLRSHVAACAGWLFPSDDGGPTTTSTIARRLARVCELTGVEYVGCHHMRRTGATAVARSGASPAALASFLGHKTLTMAQRYIALQADDGERVAAALDEFGVAGSGQL